MELLPWLHQWHSNVDPAYGVSPAEFIEALLDAEWPVLRLILVDLETTRRSESAGAPSGIANLERRRNRRQLLRFNKNCLQFDIRFRRHHRVGMVRTQIQLPDELFARAKKLCAAREISLAELARRGIEYTLSLYAPEADPDWQLPTPRSLGWRGLTDDELKAQAQMTSTEASLS